MKKQTLLKSTLCLLMALVCNVSWAQAVIFPQEKQPGTAVVNVDEANGVYSLCNDLFTASFKKAEGKLTFDGCEALGLTAGSEIFKVELRNGTEIPASAFTMGDVIVETLTGDPAAVKASRRYNGQQIKATFTHTNGIVVEWRAVLRDGSHYLRTELDIKNTGGADIAMNGITPMMYTVQNGEADRAPAVVGNTRGAVIASEKIFAGLETPMGIQTAGPESVSDLDNFAVSGWTGKESFAWKPTDDEIPAGIKALTQCGGAGKVVGSRGYVIFREAGDCNIEIKYTGANSEGNCKLHILGVDILSLDGEVISSKYHYGTTGGTHSNNTYKVNIPQIGCYMVRYFISTKDEPVQSKGNITYSLPFKRPEFVYDLARTETPYIYPEINVVEDKTVPYLLSGMTYYMAANTKQSDGSFVLRYLYVNAEGNLATATECDESNVNYKWTLEANGTDAWYIKNGGGKYLSYSPRLKVDANKYSFKLTDEAVEKGLGIYSLYNPTSSGGNYMATKADGSAFDQGSSKTNNGSWCSDYLFTTCPKELNRETAEQKDYWTNRLPGFVEWNGELPEGVTFTGTQKLAMDKYYSIAMGKLTVSYQYTGSSHRLYPLGVQLLDLQGNVVSEHFRNGATGADNAEAYNVIVPQDGIYVVRYIVQRFGTSDGWESQGTITLTYASIDCGTLTGEQSSTEQWASGLSGYTNWGGTLPNGVTKKGTAQYRDSYYMAKAGKLSLTFKYERGSHALNVLGVQLLDHNGKVVSSEFKNGKTGTGTTVTYAVDVASEGLYIVRHIVDKGARNTNYDDGWDTNGTITLSLAERVIDVLGAIGEDETLGDSWTPSTWSDIDDSKIPWRVAPELCEAQHVRVVEQQLEVKSAGFLSVTFVFTKGSGTHRLDMLGVDLLDDLGNTIAGKYELGYTGDNSNNNTYTLEIKNPGIYTIRYFANNKEEINSSGTITLALKLDYTLHLNAPEFTLINGEWSRITNLKAGEMWNVSTVVGVIAPGQARRSFLCYSERERAVPWRAVPAYISWYELNINHNNAKPGNEIANFTEDDCSPILNEWKKQLYDVYGEAPYAFVWDDGWDKYGPWEFHEGFPNGFTNMDAIGRQMGAGQGAWLGPVGGYGESGGHRRNYWKEQGGMQLSNPAYYEVFLRATTGMINNYDFRFFKFDGISAQGTAVGPDGGATGQENAEAIISAERTMRSIKEDIFLNTTVGTWASPFWYQFTDATWRQENDYGTIGNNKVDRENWITYRDRLVYQHYIQNSPLCPINTLMTHGFILTGNPNNSGDGGRGGWTCSRNIDYKHILNELRCAFACGSGMVELYNDFDLTNSITDENGKAGVLWGDIAECMKWQRKNADVLPDIHWVGGNPWTGGMAEVYGWAAWNGKRAVLTLRNGGNNEREYTFTLREALEIPAYIKSASIILTKAFTHHQDDLTGLATGVAISIDEPLTVTLPGSSVYVFDGVDSAYEGVTEIKVSISQHEVATFCADKAMAIPTGVKAYVAEKEPLMDEVDANGNPVCTITLTQVEGVIPANTGVILRGKEGEYTFISSSSESYTVVDNNLLVGYAGSAEYEVVLKPADKTNYVLTVKNEVAGFFRKDGHFKVYNNKAYLQVPTPLATPANTLRINFSNEESNEGTTGVEMTTDNSLQSTVIFDLQGRRVMNPGKGMYIVNGKKVIF